MRFSQLEERLFAHSKTKAKDQHNQRRSSLVAITFNPELEIEICEISEHDDETHWEMTLEAKYIDPDAIEVRLIGFSISASALR